jgi:hypothetical protein
MVVGRIVGNAGDSSRGDVGGIVAECGGVRTN